MAKKPLYYWKITLMGNRLAEDIGVGNVEAPDARRQFRWRSSISKSPIPSSRNGSWPPLKISNQLWGGKPQLIPVVKLGAIRSIAVYN
jgi:hypothetical protein